MLHYTVCILTTLIHWLCFFFCFDIAGARTSLRLNLCAWGVSSVLPLWVESIFRTDLVNKTIT